MYPLAQPDRSPSRRVVLQSGLAGMLVLGFHVPARAVNEPEEPPDSTQGKFAPNAFIRIDRSGQTTLVMPQVEMGQGTYTAIPMIFSPRSSTPISKKWRWCTHHLTTSSMVIQYLAFRSPATRIPFGRSGSRCARQAQRRGSCWSRPRQNSGKWTRRVARHPMGSSVTRPADAQSATANSSMPQALSRSHKIHHSRTQRISH